MSLEGTHVGSGKVRELYALEDGTLALTASDRISTFDVVLSTPIPDKGKVLTGLSAFWFARTKELVPNHLLRLDDDGRARGLHDQRDGVGPSPGTTVHQEAAVRAYDRGVRRRKLRSDQRYTLI